MRLNEQISERIKQSRKRLGFSQDVLGAKVGVSRVSISQWERGENTPNGRFLNDLAASLGVSVNWLLTGNDANPEQQPRPIIQAFMGTGKTSDALRFLEKMDASQRATFNSAVAAEDVKRILEAVFNMPPPQDGVAEEKTIFSNVEPAVIPQGRRVPILSYVQAGNWREMCEQASSFDGNVEYVTAGVDIGPRGFGLWVRGNSMAPQFKEGDLLIADPDVAPTPGDFVIASNGNQEATFKKYRPRGHNDAGQEVFELMPLNDDFPVMRSDVSPISIIATVIEHRAFLKK